MAKKKLPKNKRKKSKLPPNALETKNNVDYFKMNPVFRFSSIDSNKWTIYEWETKELKELMDTFIKMEKMTWNQITRHSGLRLKKIEGLNPPPHVSPEKTMHEIRVCKAKRVFGFIHDNIFNLVWFDRDHSVCPEGKVRR